MRCNSCGNDVSEGEGEYTIQYGFLCRTCVDSLHMIACSRCGEKFPFSDVKESQGNIYCKDCYRQEAEIAEKKIVKPKPVIKGGAGVRIPARKAQKFEPSSEIQAEEVRARARSILVKKELKAIKDEGKDTITSVLDKIRKVIRRKKEE